MAAIYALNAAQNGVEITFPEKPGDTVLSALKNAGFRWHRKKGLWYAKQTPERIALAEKLANRENAANEGNPDAVQVSEIPKADQTAGFSIPETKEIKCGGLYDGWQGGNNAKWHTDKELKAFLSADFKRAGIPATIRFNRAGYLTSITVTIRISAADVKPYDAWKENFYLSPSDWVYYRNEAGTLLDIYGERFYSLPEAEQTKLYENIRRTAYDLAVKNLTQSCHKSNIDVLTEDANKRFETVRAIVSSYNRDQSNSMVDYFDRDIYDKYAFRIA